MNEKGSILVLDNRYSQDLTNRTGGLNFNAELTPSIIEFNTDVLYFVWVAIHAGGLDFTDRHNASWCIQAIKQAGAKYEAPKMTLYYTDFAFFFTWETASDISGSQNVPKSGDLSRVQHIIIPGTIVKYSHHTNAMISPNESIHLCPILLTWFNFNPSVDK